MDPISLAIGAVGLGMQIFGGLKSSSDSKKAAEISQDEARQEQGINQQKQQQMELEGRRMQIENVRNTQRARAMAINSATTQGANLGSGLQGGLSQIADQSEFNNLGISQGLEIGRNIFSYNNAISSDKQKMASVQSSQASDQALTSLGGALTKAGPVIGQISQGFGKTSFGQSLFGGGSPSGYGVG